MKVFQDAKVAVLLATYNGARFVESQIRSLKENTTQFTLHWLDDHSTDNTREIVRAVSLSTGIALREWHQPQHQGVPAAFFRLLEGTEADIYFFCDQDDIWQPGKLDAAVANLLPDTASPVLCFSEVLMFKGDEPSVLYRLSDVLGTTLEVALLESRCFMSGFVAGNTQGFTRPLREIFVTHKEIARSHAIMHDTWMYLIAVASGAVRILPNGPTSLHRMHGSNATGTFGSWRGRGAGHLVSTWRQHQLIRRGIAREAEGFVLASATLPPGPRLERLVSIAKLVAKVNRRQSPAALVRLVRRGAMWPSRRRAFGFAMACLCSDA
jgi:rhamnosyltransferase